MNNLYKHKVLRGLLQGQATGVLLIEILMTEATIYNTL